MDIVEENRPKEKTDREARGTTLILWRNRVRSIPSSLLLASIGALLFVSLATVYAIAEIQRLEYAADALIQTSLALKTRVKDLETDHGETELLLAKWLASQDARFLDAIDREIGQQQTLIGEIRALMAAAPDDRLTLDRLDMDLGRYWRWINEVRSGNAASDPEALEDAIRQELLRIQVRVDEQAVAQGENTHSAAQHVTDVLLLLVAGTAVFGIGISFLYALWATRPLRRVRRALLQVGDGDFDDVTNLKVEGLQELKDLSHAVITMREKLRATEAAKNELLGTISHELKTPLASFQSGTEFLRSGRAGELTPNQQRVIDIMRKQSFILRNAIQEMLDMQAIQNRRLTMDSHPCPLQTIIEEAVDQISPLTAEKAQRIEWVPPPTRLEVNVDPDRTRQMITNLLSNAHKYSPRGTQITITVHRLDAFAEVTIDDRGPGIPEEHLEYAFEKFFQVPNPKAHLRGTGLGLAIVKEIAEAQQGAVTLSNRREGGLRVCLQLPLVTSQLADPSPSLAIKRVSFQWTTD